MPHSKHSWFRSGWSGSFLVDFESLWGWRPVAVLDHFTMNDFFLSSNQKFLCCNLRPLPFVMSLYTSGSTFSHLAIEGPWRQWRDPYIAFSSEGWTNPVLSNSPHTSCPGSLSTSMVFCWTHHSMLVSCTEAYSTVLQMQCHKCQTEYKSFPLTRCLHFC